MTTVTTLRRRRAARKQQIAARSATANMTTEEREAAKPKPGPSTHPTHEAKASFVKRRLGRSAQSSMRVPKKLRKAA